MTKTTDRLAEVLDCDRDSAADWLHDSGSLTWEGAGRIRRGEESHSLVELLVRHRVAATQSLSTDLDKAQQRIAELEGALAVYACECRDPTYCQRFDKEDRGWHAQETLGGVAARRAALNPGKESSDEG